MSFWRPWNFRLAFDEVWNLSFQRGFSWKDDVMNERSTHKRLLLSICVYCHDGSCVGFFRHVFAQCEVSLIKIFINVKEKIEKRPLFRCTTYSNFGVRCPCRKICLRTLWDLWSLLLSERGGSPDNWTMARRSGSLCCTNKTFLRRFSFSTTIMSALHSKATFDISSCPNWWNKPTAMPPVNDKFSVKIQYLF